MTWHYCLTMRAQPVSEVMVYDLVGEVGTQTVEHERIILDVEILGTIQNSRCDPWLEIRKTSLTYPTPGWFSFNRCSRRLGFEKWRLSIAIVSNVQNVSSCKQRHLRLIGQSFRF